MTEDNIITELRSSHPGRNNARKFQLLFTWQGHNIIRTSGDFPDYEYKDEGPGISIPVNTVLLVAK